MGAMMIIIDGSLGEGGGQILRSSLALSLVTGKPFCIERIRSKREKPGLLRQHLTAVNAAAAISQAEVEGCSIGSARLSFKPRMIRGGAYHWSIGTAGSTTLVLQTVLPALLIAKDRSEIVLEGGTHNQYAPPYEFLAQALNPIIHRMGPKLESHLERHGFFPAGGGRFTVAIEPVQKLARVDLLERGEILRKEAVGVVSQIPRRIAETEIGILKSKFSWGDDCFRIQEIKNSRGPGNILTCLIESKGITEVFTGFGERGVPANRVATLLCDEVREYLSSGVPVGCHLADQLMIPMALAGGGSFRTIPLTRHSTTNIEVIKKFLDVEITATKQDRLIWSIEIKHQ
jgi:RNA 3'-terminal phosphate cyclase (ATP)